MIKRNSNSWLVALFLGFLSVSVAPAQAGAQLAVNDALAAREFAQLMPIAQSPDGKWLAYTVQNHREATAPDVTAYMRTGVPPWCSGTDIYLVSVATGLTTDLTAGIGDNWQPSWSPDGHYLAFLSSRDGSGQARLWIWDAQKAKLRKVSSTNVRGTRVEWTPGSKGLVVTTLPEGLNLARPSGKKLDEGHAHESGLPTVILYRSEQQAHGPVEAESNPWSLEVYRRDLTLIDVDSGRDIALVHDKRIATYLISPDGSDVAFTIPSRFEKPGSQQILFDLALVKISTGKMRAVASDARMDFDGSAISWSPDGTLLAFRTGGPNEKTFDCYIADPATAAPRNVTMFPLGSAADQRPLPPLWDGTNDIFFINNGALWRAAVAGGKAAEIGSVPNRRITNLIASSADRLWTTKGSTSTVVVTHDDFEKQDGFYEIELKTGGGLELLEQGQCYTCSGVMPPFVVTPDGQQVIYFSEDDRNSGDLWIGNASFRSVRRLTRLNPGVDPAKMGAARLIDWLGDNGERLHGALLLPPDYETGKRYPLIVWVYGGELLSNRLHDFGMAGSGPFNMQLLATRGYAVLLPDAPQHADAPMADLAKTVLPGVSKVVEMGIADPDRLGIAGHSYGGYSVLSLAVQSTRFKAAVEMDGYGDIVSAYGAMNKDGAAFHTSVQEGGQGSMGGTPWQVRDKYIENSPFFYLDSVTTPLLIIHGSNDTTAAPFLGDELFVGLRRLGKEVEYAKYDGEGHSPLQWSRANQEDLCNRMIAWFDAHLKRAIVR
jgi:dipeptidyl aminopeptidase/acylaminoacyl peptidase